MLKFEPLERRSLMTATAVTAVLTDGVLTITGTEGNDWIDVSQGSQFVVSSGLWADHRVLGRWDVNEIQRIVIDAKGGDDHVTLNDWGSFTSDRYFGEVDVPALILGGDGNDTIIGGWNADMILGGNGDDRIQAGRGDDVIDGGLGADQISRQKGDNTVYVDDLDSFVVDLPYMHDWGHDTIIRSPAQIASPTETISIGLAFLNATKEKSDLRFWD